MSLFNQAKFVFLSLLITPFLQAQSLTVYDHLTDKALPAEEHTDFSNLCTTSVVSEMVTQMFFDRLRSWGASIEEIERKDIPPINFLVYYREYMMHHPPQRRRDEWTSTEHSHYRIIATFENGDTFLLNVAPDTSLAACIRTDEQ